MKKLFVISILTLWMAFPAFSQAKWLDLKGGPELQTVDHALPALIKTTDSRNDGLDLSYQLPGVLLDHAKGGGHAFTQMSIPGSGISDQVGYPELPVQRKFFLVPVGSKVTYDVQNIQTRSVRLPESGFPAWVMPRQLPVPKIPGALESAVFQWNSNYYSTGMGEKSVQLNIVSTGVMRHYQLMMIEWSPVDLNPVTGECNILTSMDVHLHFDNSNRTTQTDLFLSNTSLFLNPLQKPSARDTGNYLILVASSFQDEISALVTAKTAQGYTVSTYVVAAGTTSETIKNYITTLWGTPQAPDYILIIGDTDKIPAWTGGGEGNPHTDIQYGCMDGVDDWYPDMAIGRFPVDTVTQLGYVIDKTIFFEDGNFPRPEYVTEAVFMSSTDNYQITEGTHEYVIDNYLTPAGLTSQKLYTVTYNATTQQVSDAFNEGRIYGIYSGHGGTTSWADGPPFSQSDVNALTNSGLYAFVTSFACITGSYHLDECFTETWILAEDKGACAIYGSSVNSYWTEDDILEKKLFEAIYTDGIRQVSPAWQEADLKFLAHFGVSATTRRYFEMYNLMGDPSLAIPEPGGGSAMRVSPFKGFSAEGPSGGPFSPESKVFSIENVSDTAFDFSVVSTEDWLTVLPSSGTVGAGAVVEITVTINAQANVLQNGPYQSEVQFTNTTDNDGDTSRTVDLTVGLPEMVYEFNMDQDPLWTMEGGWAYGVPTGLGGEHGNPDPTEGATGDHVLGYNLEGDYPNNMVEEHVTSTAIDCTDLARTSVKFQRWLGVEANSYDHAYFKVSTDGNTWETIYSNQNTVSDDVWGSQSYDISMIADGSPTLYLRWTMGTTDGSYTYCGWNLDDIQVWGVLPDENLCPADVDGDGTVDMSDFSTLCTSWHDEGVNFNGITNTDLLNLLDILSDLGACPVK